jgi:hypothetical protein
VPHIPQFFPGLPDLPALVELKSRRQWVSWLYRTRSGSRPTKPPINPNTGMGASHSDPTSWGSYDEALAYTQRRNLPGVGYVLSEDDDIGGADLDHCLMDGRLAPWAQEIVDLNESYTEISPSGSGLRIFMRGKPEKTIKSDAAHVELYRDKRFLTVTGLHFSSTPIDIRPAPKTIEALLSRANGVKPSPRQQPQIGQGGDFFRRVNGVALRNLGAWAPILFPEARLYSSGAWRITSRALGRDLQEDLSLAPEGICDFGIADMGDPRQGKRSAIDIVMEYGAPNTPKDAALWLCDRLGISPDRFDAPTDPVAAQSQQNLAAKVRSDIIALPPPCPLAVDTSEMDDLLIPDPYVPQPGILGEITAHILETALFPVPDFATLASAVFASALFGRRWTEPLTGGGLNLYAIATAPTGWGKDHPLQEPRSIAYRCEMVHLLGPDEFKSDSAIEKTLRKGPVRACFMDEIGIVLQANASKNAAAWEKKVRKALLQVYSSSKGMWTGSQAAGDDNDKGAEPIHRPLLSIYGTSTPEELYKGLTEDNIRDGLFGRLIFASPDDKPKRQKPGAGRYDQIAELVRIIREFVPEIVPQKQRALYHANIRNALHPPTVVRVPADRDAAASIEQILEWQRDLTEKESKLSFIANRAAENAGKLATLRALSRDYVKPEVTFADVQWGWSIVERSLRVITRDIERHMVGSEFEGLMKAIRWHLAEAPKKTLPQSHLIRRHGISRATGYELRSALELLQQSGEISIETIRRGRVITLL